MPVIEPGNTQQILQMSSAVEKVQTQQVQQLPNGQIQIEAFNKLKKEKTKQVKRPVNSQETQVTDSKNVNPQIVPSLKKHFETSEEESSEHNTQSGFPENPQGENLNIVV